MKTLIVQSYHAEWEPKIGPVADLVAGCSEWEVVSDNDLAPGYDLTGYEAIVLSGSPSLISQDEFVPGYLEFLKQVEIPVLGICYGHQLLARAFGSKVLNGGKMIEGDLPVNVIEHEPLFQGLPREVEVRESHREFVVLEDLARVGFRLLANSATCAVEAIGHQSRPLFGVQFHIERSGDVGKTVMANFCRFAAGRATNRG